jgi:hypothetical protein
VAVAEVLTKTTSPVVEVLVVTEHQQALRAVGQALNLH